MSYPSLDCFSNPSSAYEKGDFLIIPAGSPIYSLGENHGGIQFKKCKETGKVGCYLTTSFQNSKNRRSFGMIFSFIFYDDLTFPTYKLDKKYAPHYKKVIVEENGKEVVEYEMFMTIVEERSKIWFTKMIPFID